MFPPCRKQDSTPQKYNGHSFQIEAATTATTKGMENSSHTNNIFAFPRNYSLATVLLWPDQLKFGSHHPCSHIYFTFSAHFVFYVLFCVRTLMWLMASLSTCNSCSLGGRNLWFLLGQGWRHEILHSYKELILSGSGHLQGTWWELAAIFVLQPNHTVSPLRSVANMHMYMQRYMQRQPHSQDLPTREWS